MKRVTVAGTHACALGEPREALEPGHRIEREQHLREPPLRCAEHAHALANQLSDEEFRH